MNILLVLPNYGFQARTQSPPLGLLSIATYLKGRGYLVRVYDRNVERISLEKVARTFRPDAVGVSMLSMRQIEDGVEVSRKIRNLGIPVVWGGHMATIAAEMALREGAADYVVSGEGEITFHELLRAIKTKGEFSQIKGIAWLEASSLEIRRTPVRELTNLAELPAIDFSFVNPQKYFGTQIGCTRMMYLYASKGCPGRCTFCVNKNFNRSQYRQRPVGHVISEIETLISKHGLNGVYFTDEMLGADKRAIFDFCDRLRSMQMNITWGGSTRLCHFRREEYQRLYNAGCRWLFFGVESGSPEMLARIRKGIDLAKINRDFQCCRDIGISTACGFIIGFPDETQEQLRESIDLMLRLDTDIIQVTVLLPTPGTDIYDDLTGSGRLAPIRTLREWGGVTPQEGVFSNFSNVPTLDLHVVQCFFLWRSFFRKNFSKGAPRYNFALITALSSLRNIFRQGLFNMCKHAFSSARFFFTVAWYRYAYPAIRKKYGL